MSLDLFPLFVEFRWLPADYWDLSIPVYLYFAAVAGGAYLTGASACFLRSLRDRGPCCLESEIARWGFMTAVASAAIAGLAVLSHLAVVYRAILFPVYLTNFSSWITIGTWILVLLAIFSVVCLLLQLFGEDAAQDDGASLWPRVIVAKLGLLDLADRLVDRVRPPMSVFAGLHIVGSVLALATMYTGFELAIVETVPLWNDPIMLPLVFLTSGVAAGIGITLAITMLFEREIGPIFGGYALVTAVLSGISLALVGHGWNRLAASDVPAAAASYSTLSEGTMYVGVILVALGFLAPLIVGLVLGIGGMFDKLSPTIEKLGGPALIGSFGLLFIGALVLRVLLLLAAEQNPVVVVGP